MPGFAPQPPPRYTRPSSSARPPRGRNDFGMAHSPVLGAESRRRQTNIAGMSAKQAQILLRHLGYDVAVTGKMDARTLTGIDAYVKGKPVQQYNDWAARHFGSLVYRGTPAQTVRAGGGSNIHPPSNAPGIPAGGGNGGGSKAPKDPTQALLNSLLQDAGNVGTMIPRSTASDIAGLGHDANIADLERQLANEPGQSAQELHDISHWYGQVLDAQAKAAAADKAGGQAGVDSMKGITAALVSSLGGAANQGSGEVGAAGVDATGTLQALANSQDFYNSQLAPLLKEESAGQLTSARARQAQARQALLDNLANERTARGQAEAAAMADIIDKNNALAQTRFGNRASILNTIEAIQATGAKNALAIAKAAAAGAPKQLSPHALQQVSASALSHFIDPNTHTIDPKAIAQLGVQGVVRAVKSEYLSAGLDWTNPQVAQSAMGTLRQLGITPDPAWFG